MVWQWSGIADTGRTYGKRSFPVIRNFLTTELLKYYLKTNTYNIS